MSETEQVQPKSRLLNIGCGGVRPPEPWVNVDTLLAEHFFYGPECDQLKAEPNYHEFNVMVDPWPWPANHFAGILASHVLEHFDCLQALKIVRQCHHVLAPGGILRVSVPDAAFFRAVYPEDCADNAERLFGELLYPPKATMLDYALYFDGHRQTFGEDSLWCLLANGGFSPCDIYRVLHGQTMQDTEVGRMLAEQDNRARFSLYMDAVKGEE